MITEGVKRLDEYYASMKGESDSEKKIRTAIEINRLSEKVKNGTLAVDDLSDPGIFVAYLNERTPTKNSTSILKGINEVCASVHGFVEIKNRLETTTLEELEAIAEVTWRTISEMPPVCIIELWYASTHAQAFDVRRASVSHKFGAKYVLRLFGSGLVT